MESTVSWKESANLEKALGGRLVAVWREALCCPDTKAVQVGFVYHSYSPDVYMGLLPLERCKSNVDIHMDQTAENFSFHLEEMCLSV